VNFEWIDYETRILEQGNTGIRLEERGEGLTKARRTIQNAGENTKEVLKGSGWLLVKNKENLKAAELQKLQTKLAVPPELKACYEFKECFRNLFNQNLNYQGAEESLPAWVAGVEAGQSNALQAFVKTLRNWWQQILNHFIGRHTNGPAEGGTINYSTI